MATFVRETECPVRRNDATVAGKPTIAFRVIIGCSILYAALATISALTLAIKRNSYLNETTGELNSQLLLQSKLDYLRQYQGVKIVFLGDSVVFGHTLKDRGDSAWREHNLPSLVQASLREQHPGLIVMNLALDGCLPADLDRVAEQLSDIKIDMLVCDVGLRAFSSDFADEESAYSRPWIAAMGATSTRQHATDLLHTPQKPLQGLQTGRDYFWSVQLDGQPREWVRNQHVIWNEATQRSTGWADDDNVDDTLVLLMKAKQRFRTIDLTSRNFQRRAFDRFLERAAKIHPHVLVFYATENPAHLGELIEGPRYSDLHETLAKIITQPARTNLSYLGPQSSLQAAHFVDHVHLTEGGTRILATELSRQIRARVFASASSGTNVHRESENP